MLDFSILQLLDEYLEAKTADNFRDNSHFHPSEFHGCKRLMVYKYYLQKGIVSSNGAKEKITPCTQRIFDNGHHVHFRWGEYLEDRRCTGKMLKGVWKCKNSYAHEDAWKVDKNKKKEECFPKFYGQDHKLGIIKPEVPCEDCGCPDYIHSEIGFLDEETWIGGHIDCLLLLPTGDHLILDYKSIRKRLFDKLYDGPKPEHLVQMQCYLYVSGLKYGKFIYECKDDQEVKEFDVIKDDKMVQHIVEEAKNLKTIVTVQNSSGKWTLPPRANSTNPVKDEQEGLPVIRYNKDMSTCMRCMYRKHCWGLK